MEQSEVDSMMQEINKEAGSAPSGQEGEIGWDDVKDELEKSKQAPPRTEVSDPDFNELQKTGVKVVVFDLQALDPKTMYPCGANLSVQEPNGQWTFFTCEVTKL